MRRCRGAGLAGLAAVLLVAAGRAQVQQEPLAETTEGTGISINCSHPNIQSNEDIFWYRQLPGRGPAFIAFGHKGSKELPDPPGRLSVAADRRSSSLWLAQPRRGDAAVYYCAVGDTGALPLRPPGLTLSARPRVPGRFPRRTGTSTGIGPVDAPSRRAPGALSSHGVRSSSSTPTGEGDVKVTGTFKRSTQWLSVETTSVFDRIQNLWTSPVLRYPEKIFHFIP
ncbi:uncharacterized protein LOC142419739 [Mycteria americana]|uniref:uncharacterized protein LOC142419739 n=1 Tax=Mycteria americana TaxID=33587 RepID=UPI003F58B848